MDNPIICQRETPEEYHLDILLDPSLDKSLITKVKNHGDLDLAKTNGVEQSPLDSILSRITRRNIKFFGIMQGEIPLNIEKANNGFQIPLVSTAQLNERLQKIKEDDRKKIAYLHINTIQIVLRSTFREGLKTPVTIKVIDNRMTSNSDKLLGEIEGDLGYTTVKFCVSLQFPIPIITRTLNSCIGIICDFKNSNLMQAGDSPLVCCYRIAYALSNSCLSLNYKNQDQIFTEKLFLETSTKIKPEEVTRDFLKSQSSRFHPSSSSLNSALVPISNSNTQLVPPTTRKTLFSEEDEIRKLHKQMETLQGEVSDLNRKI